MMPDFYNYSFYSDYFDKRIKNYHFLPFQVEGKLIDIFI
jgi:hypothetical protein